MLSETLLLTKMESIFLRKILSAHLYSKKWAHKKIIMKKLFKLLGSPFIVWVLY